MKNIFVKLMFTLIFFLSISQVEAQSDFVFGTVTAFNSLQIENVEVYSKKSKNTVYTDSLGRFSIQRIKKDKLLFKAAGFKSQWVKVAEVSDSLVVDLVFGGSEKDMEVAVGGGYMSKDELTVAIDQYNLDKENFVGYSNVIELMKAKYAQIQFVGREIRVRGGEKSINASNAALILVNEFATDYAFLEALPASDVKSISVLKGSAASVYGSRGANGVIIITTKNNVD